MSVLVVNKFKEPYDIYIGRGSLWGNPYTSIQDKATKAEFVVGTREESIECYRQYLFKQVKSGEVSIDQLLALDGKILGCFCKPKPCHGDVISKAVEWAKTVREKQ